MEQPQQYDGSDPEVPEEQHAQEVFGAPSLAYGSYQREKKRLLDGLRRVEGQVRGVQRMVEEERYCVEVINQIAAARMALARLALLILEEHTRGCVTRALQSREETDQVIAELIATVRRLV